MRELFAYLREHGFVLYLCASSDEEFLRAFATKTYDVPRERILGSTVKKQLGIEKETVVLKRTADLLPPNDGDEKVFTIARTIGRRPVFAAGNVRSGGDVAMLTYSRLRSGPSFALVINHDDAAGSTRTRAERGDARGCEGSRLHGREHEERLEGHLRSGDQAMRFRGSIRDLSRQVGLGVAEACKRSMPPTSRSRDGAPSASRAEPCAASTRASSPITSCSSRRRRHAPSRAARCTSFERSSATGATARSPERCRFRRAAWLTTPRSPRGSDGAVHRLGGPRVRLLLRLAQRRR